MHRVTAGCLCVLGGFALNFVLPRSTINEASTIATNIAESAPRQSETITSPAPTIANPGKQMVRLLDEAVSLTRDVELAEALFGMTKEDFAAIAIELKDRLKKQPYDSELTEAILDQWFQVDPVSARDAAKQAASDPKTRSGFRSLASPFVAAAARHDPQWALDNLMCEPGTAIPGWSSNAALMLEVTRKDRKLAAAWMEKFKDSGWRQSLLAGYVNGLAESEPLAALDVAISEKTFERVNLIPTAVEIAARTGSNMASLALSKIDDAALRRTTAWRAAEIIAEESVTDPFTFLQKEAGLDHSPSKDDTSWGHLATKVLSTIVDRNAVEAANWALNLPKESREMVLGRVLDSWSHSDPEAMLTWTREQQSHTEAGIETPASSFAADFGKLLAAKSLLKQGQIQEALQAAPKQMKDKAADGLNQFVWEAAMSNPEATANWVTSLPAGESRDLMISTAAQHYAMSQPEQAGAWIEQLPSGSVRDSAILGVIRSFTREDPSAAGEWVARISDPVKVEEGVKQVWGAWVQKDEVAAREWLNSLPGVSERTKRRLLGQ